jgi:hypothetical protein
MALVVQVVPKPVTLIAFTDPIWVANDELPGITAMCRGLHSVSALETTPGSD